MTVRREVGSGLTREHSVSAVCTLCDSFMIKRAQGRKRFGMKNFKKRWFRLTNHEFTYQKSKGKEVFHSLPQGPARQGGSVSQQCKLLSQEPA